MKIEEGKFYRTRDGRKAGPYVAHPDADDLVWVSGDHSSARWKRDGRSGSANIWSESPGDLIAEWTDGPVREVTRKEIVPGTYGRIQVSHTYDRIGDEVFDHQAVINLTARDGSMMDRGNFSAAELRAAASTLTAIADALEETK